MKQITGGLHEHWSKVVRILEEIVPVYERVNRVISFGRDLDYRREGILAGIRPGNRVLDAGCGPGTMSDVALSSVNEIGELVLLDVLRPMLDAARRRFNDARVHLVNGTFEFLPFRAGSFDAAMSGFALRDSRDMGVALTEITRVLRPEDGRYVIVDLGKPNNPILRGVIGFYWKFFVALLATFVVGRKGLDYSVLYTTYREHPRNGHMNTLLSTFFTRVEFATRMMGGVAIVVAEGARPTYSREPMSMEASAYSP